MHNLAWRICWLWSDFIQFCFWLCWNVLFCGVRWCCWKRQFLKPIWCCVINWKKLWRWCTVAFFISSFAFSRCVLVPLFFATSFLCIFFFLSSFLSFYLVLFSPCFAITIWILSPESYPKKNLLPRGAMYEQFSGANFWSEALLSIICVSALSCLLLAITIWFFPPKAGRKFSSS